VNTAVETVTATEPTVDYRLVRVLVTPIFEKVVDGASVGEFTLAAPVTVTEDRAAELSWGVPVEVSLSDIRERLIEREG
jgi:hypothetical protein